MAIAQKANASSGLFQNRRNKKKAVLLCSSVEAPLESGGLAGGNGGRETKKIQKDKEMQKCSLICKCHGFHLFACCF